MTGRFTMWDGNSDVEVDVPVSGGENVMVPVIRAIVASADDPDLVLLQRRANPSESVIGQLEIPGGRWRAGEDPESAVAREVLEETGITLTEVDGIVRDGIDGRRTIASVEPFSVIAGVEGAFPAAHVILTARGTGEPRDEPGESADVRWWPRSEIVEALQDDPTAFVPYARVALAAYTEVGVGS